MTNMKELVAKATEGPWYIEGPSMGFASIESDRGIVFAVSNPSPEYGDPDMPDEEKQANIELCAASRTWVPAAIEVMKKMHAGLTAAKAMLPHHGKLNDMAHDQIDAGIAAYKELLNGS